MTLDKFQTGIHVNAWVTPYIAAVLKDGTKAEIQLEMQHFLHHETTCEPDISSKEYLECQRAVLKRMFFQWATCPKGMFRLALYCNCS